MNKLLSFLVALIPALALAGYETGGQRETPEQIRWLQLPSKPMPLRDVVNGHTPRCRFCESTEETKHIDPVAICWSAYAYNQRGDEALGNLNTAMGTNCVDATYLQPEYVFNAVPNSANWKFGASNSSLSTVTEPWRTAGHNTALFHGGHFNYTGTQTTLTADLTAGATSATVASCSGFTNGEYVVLVKETEASGGSFGLDDWANDHEIIRLSDGQSGRPAGCSGTTMNFMAGYSGGATRWMSTSGNTGIAFDATTPKTYVKETTILYSGGPPAISFGPSTLDSTKVRRDGNNKTLVQAYGDFMLNWWNTSVAGTTYNSLDFQCFEGDVDYGLQSPACDLDNSGSNDPSCGVDSNGYNFGNEGYDEFYAHLKTGMAAPGCVVGGIWNARSLNDNLNGIQHEGFTKDAEQLNPERHYRWDWGGFNRVVMDYFINTNRPYRGTTLSKFWSVSYQEDKNSDNADTIFRVPKGTATTGTTGTTLECSGCDFSTASVAARDHILNHNTQATGVVTTVTDLDTLSMFPSGLVGLGDEFSIVSTPAENVMTDTATSTTTGQLVDSNGDDGKSSDDFCKNQIQEGQIVYNSTDATYAEVTEVNGNCNSVDLSADIFTIDETYNFLARYTGRDEQVHFEELTSYALGVPYYSHMTLKPSSYGNDDTVARKSRPYNFVYVDQAGVTGYSKGQSTMADVTGTLIAADAQDPIDTRSWKGERKWVIDLLWEQQQQNVTKGSAIKYYDFDDTAATEGWTSDNGSVTISNVTGWAGNPFGCDGDAGSRCGALRLARSAYQSGINLETVVSPSSDFGITKDKWYLVLVATRFTSTEQRWRPITVNLVGLNWHEMVDFPVVDGWQFWMAQIKATGTDATARLKLHLGAYELNNVELDAAGIWESDNPWMGLIMARFEDAVIVSNFSGVNQTNISLGRAGGRWQRILRPSWAGSATAGAVRFDPDNWMVGGEIARIGLLKNETARVYAPL